MIIKRTSHARYDIWLVGTKVETRALKDGDLIEVDGNQWIIKVIKAK